MGNPHSRPEDRVRQLSREINSLRNSIRLSSQNLSKTKKESILRQLAVYSSEVSSMRGKLRHRDIEEALKKTAETMEEVIRIEPTQLDEGAVESDSFVHMPISKRRSNSLGSIRSTRKPPTDQNSTGRSSGPNLRNIETKLDELKSHINSSIENRDHIQLRFYKETLKVIATDLELIHAEKGSLLEKRKESAEKKCVSLFQKVLKVLSVTSRSNSNFHYETNHQKKHKAMTELAEIEVHLAENESLLDKLIKEKISPNYGAIRNNLMEISQSLNKVEIVDDEVKKKVVLLSNKFTETVRTLDEIMAKREFYSKFSKCIETYERIMKNFDAATNANQTLDNLNALRASVEHLEEINDTTKKRKRELLYSINHQIESFGDVIKKQSDQKIIEQIVEDNVTLRKKGKGMDKEHTVIDQFVTYWNNVRSNFDVNSYSNLSLLRIDNVLEEMQKSIYDIRIGIAKKCETNPPTNLSRKHSQSVPRLNTRKSYDSERSIDRQSEKIVRAKAKMYNISTPELQHIEQPGHQQHQYENSRFSKIEEVKLQVYYIREKINGNHNKSILKDKLEHCRKELEQYLNDSNKTVANNASIVSNDILELQYKVFLAELRELVIVLSKRVQNFNGTRYDREYDEMKNDLLKMQIDLESFNVPTQYETLVQEKGELLDEVSNSLESLVEKGSYYKKHEDENVRNFKRRLQNLSDKVKRFSGTHKGVLYNDIERSLTKLLLDVGEQVEDKLWSTEISKETERLLKILEQRSSRAESFRTTKPEDSKAGDQNGMTKIKHDLHNIKNEIDRTSEHDVDAVVGLQSRLDLVNLELSQIPANSNEQLVKEKEIFANEAQTLKNVVDARVALGQQPMVQWPERKLHSDLQMYPKNDVNQELERFESAFEAIKREITAPNNEKDVHKFYKLTQDIKKLIEKLNKYKFIRGTDLHTRKSGLVNEMQYYVQELEKGAQDVNYVLSIERNLDKLEDLFQNNQEHDLKMMAKELQTIQKKLQDHNFNTSDEVLRNRKTSVQQKTEDLAHKLKEMENYGIRKAQQEAKKIEDIEENVKRLTPEVMSFIGLKSDNKYYELNETTIRTIIALDKIDTEKADLQKKKIHLLKQLDMLGKTLDEIAKQTQELAHLEEELDQASIMLDNFSGKEEEIKTINRIMEIMKIHLNELKVTNQLITRKNMCIEKFSALFNKCMTLSPHTSAVGRSDESTHNSYHEQTAPGYTTQIYNFVTKNVDDILKNNHKPQPENEDDLKKIENQIAQYEVSIDNANDANTLQEIDDFLNESTLSLGSMQVKTRRIGDTYQRIENLSLIVEKKIEDITRLEYICRQADAISRHLQFALPHDQIIQLEEQLIQLQDALSKIDNPGFKTQIDGCILTIMMHLQNISEYKKSVQTTSV